MTPLDEVKAQICAALETPEDDWLAHAVRIIIAHKNAYRARKIYDISTMGGRIRAARQLAGMQQRELARRTKFSQQYLSLVERDLRELPMRKVPGMAMSLGVSVPWLLRGGPEGGPRTHGDVLRVEPTPRALRKAELARRLALARAQASEKNRLTQKAHTKA